MPRMRIAAARKRGADEFRFRSNSREIGCTEPLVNTFCPRKQTHEHRAFNQAERDLEELRNNH